MKSSEKPIKNVKAKQKNADQKAQWWKTSYHIFDHGNLVTIFGKIKIEGILTRISGTRINTLGFVGTNYAFSKSGRGDAEVERKHHDLGEEKLQKAKDKWNEYRMKQFGFSIKDNVREMRQ